MQKSLSSPADLRLYEQTSRKLMEAWLYER